MQYLLTVVIATKNRQFYCIETIKSILSIDKNKTIQIAISDNSDTDEIQKYVNTAKDSRIKYTYNNGPITNTDNFNMALSLAEGKYVTLLGDDDGLLPNIFEKLNWAVENDIDSFSARRTVIYYWPSSLKEYPNGHLILPHSNNRRNTINVRQELISLLRNGFQHYLIYSLPKVYHGFVKREILVAIRKKTGHFIGGLSPDIYVCIAVSMEIDIHYEFQTPLTIAGVCAKSTTADLFTGKHRGELKSMPHLLHRSIYQWSKLVPEYYSPNTIWAETAIKALEETGNTFLIEKYFDAYYLLAQGYVNNRKDIASLVISKSINYKDKILSVNSFMFFVNILISFIKIFTKKSVNILIYRFVLKDAHVKNILDIHQAVNASVVHYIK